MEIMIVNWICLMIAVVFQHKAIVKQATNEILNGFTDKRLQELLSDDSNAKGMSDDIQSKVIDEWFNLGDLNNCNPLKSKMMWAALSIVIPFLFVAAWIVKTIYAKIVALPREDRKLMKLKKIVQSEICSRQGTSDASISQARMTDNEGIDKGLSICA